MGVAFEFATAGRVVFGAGASRQAAKAVGELGRRALLVTGRRPDRAAWLADALAADDVEVQNMAVPAEPDLDLVTRGAALARDSACEVVVAVGGGSAIDAAKAVAALTPNGGDVLDYLEVIGDGRPLDRSSLPVVAVPTTAGTGSEVTKNAVLASPAHRVKVSLRSSSMLPRVAVVDPELARDLPANLTASTGLDALTQLIEPYLSSRATAFTDALCVAAIPRAARSLARACRDGHDMDAREDMAFASLLSGMALANAGLGAVHGFAGTIGGAFAAPHGAVCAALLPHVLEGNLQAIEVRQPGHPVRERFDVVARLLTGRSSATAAEGIRWIADLVAELGVPSLGRYGVGPGDVPAVVSQAARSSSMKGNPVPLEPGELEHILTAAL